MKRFEYLVRQNIGDPGARWLQNCSAHFCCAKTPSIAIWVKMVFLGGGVGRGGFAIRQCLTSILAEIHSNISFSKPLVVSPLSKPAGFSKPAGGNCGDSITIIHDPFLAPSPYKNGVRHHLLGAKRFND
jgi:hypothetical protein